jgi:hypothetical protein
MKHWFQQLQKTAKRFDAGLRAWLNVWHHGILERLKGKLFQLEAGLFPIHPLQIILLQILSSHCVVFPLGQQTFNHRRLSSLGSTRRSIRKPKIWHLVGDKYTLVGLQDQTIIKEKILEIRNNRQTLAISFP